MALVTVPNGSSTHGTPYCLPGQKLVSDTTEFRFTDAGEYIPRTIVNDLGSMSLRMQSTAPVEFEDGDLVTGTVVRIDRDEVLLDIEGVIPSRELSIRNAVDPSEIVD